MTENETGQYADTTGGTPEAAADATRVSRRRLLTLGAAAWAAFAAAATAGLAMTARFMFPNVLYEPPTTFDAGVPEDFAAGMVDERFKQQHGTWIVNDGTKIFALAAVCTHLGCTPNWMSTEEKFKCPCHGSGFSMEGMNLEGPAPRPLERYRIFLDGAGRLVVDKSKVYRQERGQWDDSESCVKV